MNEKKTDEWNKKQIKTKQEKNRKIYLWIVDFISKNGKAPTLQELADAGFGFHSRVRAGQVLKDLEKEGYIVKNSSKLVRNYGVNPKGLLRVFTNTKK